MRFAAIRGCRKPTSAEASRLDHYRHAHRRRPRAGRRRARGAVLFGQRSSTPITVRATSCRASRFTVSHGEILALLGRNGAGKTSTLRDHRPAGQSGPAHRRNLSSTAYRSTGFGRFEAAQAGIQLVPEDRRIIQGLTVEENLLLAQVAPGDGWELDRIYGHFPRLAERRRQEGVTLSGGEQQMLAIARALARDIKPAAARRAL